MTREEFFEALAVLATAHPRAIPESRRMLDHDARQRVRISELETALRSLMNEAIGFVGMACPVTHGVTNISVLRAKIVDARCALIGDIAPPPCRECGSTGVVGGYVTSEGGQFAYDCRTCADTDKP